MTDPRQPQDELVSTVLDGEADEADQAAVQADPDLRARLETFRSVRRSVAAAVPGPDADRRDAAIAAAIAAVDRPEGDDANGSVVDLAEARARRTRRARRVLVAGAAVVTVLALAAGLSRLGEGDDDASTQAADAPTAEPDGAAVAAATDLALGAVDDVGTLAERVADETGLGGPSADAFGGDGAVGLEATAPDDGDVGGDLPGSPNADESGEGTATLRSSEDCTVTLIEDRPGLTGQLAHGTVTYRGVDAYVLVYHDPSTGGVLAIVMSTTDCTLLAEVPF